MVFEENAVNDYVDYIKSAVAGDMSGIKAVIDCANGSASATAHQIFEGIGAQCEFISCEPDGTNINENCGSTHLGNLQKAVKERGADIGIAFDGDADRCLAVDENGEIIDGDKLLAIFSRYMKDCGKLKNDTCVVTVMSNIGFFKFAESENVNAKITAVGDRYVLEEMLKNGYNLGGEQSGHIIFSKYAKTGDGILTAVQLLGALIQNNKRLSEMGAMMTKYPQILLNVRVADKHGWEDKAAIKNVIKKYQDELGDNGQILVRASGTEPLIRIMAEGPKQERLEEIASAIAEVVNCELG